MTNVKLLRETLQYIKDHPEEHDQAEWFRRTPCGTTACFAGTALLLSGYQPYWIDARWTNRAVPVDAEHSSAENVRVPGAARDLLGLTQEDANALFEAFNDIGRIETIVEEIIAESEKEPPDA